MKRYQAPRLPSSVRTAPSRTVHDRNNVQKELRVEPKTSQTNQRTTRTTPKEVTGHQLLGPFRTPKVSRCKKSSTHLVDRGREVARVGRRWSPDRCRETPQWVQRETKCLGSEEKLHNNTANLFGTRNIYLEMVCNIIPGPSVRGVFLYL